MKRLPYPTLSDVDRADKLTLYRWYMFLSTPVTPGQKEVLDKIGDKWIAHIDGDKLKKFKERWSLQVERFMVCIRRNIKVV